LPIAFYLLTILLAATPILAIANGAFAQHAVAFTAAIMLLVAAMAPEREITAAAQLLKRFSLAILVPILWMVLQTVPLPLPSLVNPIWSTTGIALNKSSLVGHISVDPGATLRGLISYLSVLSLMMSTVIITRDRHRAETTLFVLTAVTTFMSVEVLVGQLDSFAGIIPIAGTATSTFAAAAALAALANGALIAMAVERHLNRPDPSNLLASPLLFRLFLGLAGVAISLAAMKVLTQASLLAATGLGFTVFLFIAVVRRLGIRPWPSAILLAIFVAMAIAVALPRFQLGPSAAMLGFVTQAALGSLEFAQRALSDASWTGTGVGTLELLSKVYQDFGTEPVLAPPSTAVLIATEWGRPALLILIAFAIQLFLFTLRGAVRRGRDFFFASVAAAAVLVMVCESFLDSSLLSPTIQIIVAVMIGLGLSQSTGRTSGL
jgi:hypothetical protein